MPLVASYIFVKYTHKRYVYLHICIYIFVYIYIYNSMDLLPYFVYSKPLLIIYLDTFVYILCICKDFDIYGNNY